MYLLFLLNTPEIAVSSISPLDSDSNSDSDTDSTFLDSN